MGPSPGFPSPPRAAPISGHTGAQPVENTGRGEIQGHPGPVLPTARNHKASTCGLQLSPAHWHLHCTWLYADCFTVTISTCWANLGNRPHYRLSSVKWWLCAPLFLWSFWVFDVSPLGLTPVVLSTYTGPPKHSSGIFSFWWITVTTELNLHYNIFISGSHFHNCYRLFWRREGVFFLFVCFLADSNLSESESLIFQITFLFPHLSFIINPRPVSAGISPQMPALTPWLLGKNWEVDKSHHICSWPLSTKHRSRSHAGYVVWWARYGLSH